MKFLVPTLSAGLLALACACGQGNTFGVAPGPPPPDPPPPPEADAGPLPPEPDAGPPPPPPPDGGVVCTTVYTAATPQESLTEFSAQALPAAFGCASCHNGKSPAGDGIGWGAATNDATGWHDAVIGLADRQSALAPTDTSLYTHFAGSDGTHPDNATAKAGLLAWLDLHRNGIGEEVCEEADAGVVVDDCPSTFRDVTPIEDQAEFNSRNLAADFSCASCHVGKSPTGTGIDWGAATDDAVGWYAASAAIADRDSASPNNQTALYTHFNGVNGTHGVNAAARDSTNGWLIYRQTQIEEPGVCEDAGPAGPDCTPVPVDEAGSLAKFTTLDIASPYNQCANCHVGKSPTGTGIAWGADSNSPGPAEWHAAAVALGETEAGTAPNQTSLFLHFNGINATHPANDTASGAVDEWLTYVRSPQPPEGCE